MIRRRLILAALLPWLPVSGRATERIIPTPELPAAVSGLTYAPMTTPAPTPGTSMAVPPIAAIAQEAAAQAGLAGPQALMVLTAAGEPLRQGSAAEPAAASALLGGLFDNDDTRRAEDSIAVPEGASGYQRLKKAFDAGRPAQLSDLRGWKAGRRFFRDRPDRPQGALLIGGESDPGTSTVGGGPGLVDLPEREFKIVALVPPVGELPEALSAAYRDEMAAKTATRAFWSESAPMSGPSRREYRRTMDDEEFIIDNYGVSSKMIRDAYVETVEEFRVFGPYLVVRKHVAASPGPGAVRSGAQPWSSLSYAYFFKDVTPTPGQVKQDPANGRARQVERSARREPILAPGPHGEDGKLSVAAIVMIPLAAAGALVYIIAALDFFEQFARWVIHPAWPS